jgi:hypothetical protein
VIRRVPVAELVVAVIVAVPAPGKVAVLLDGDAKFTTAELLEVQVAWLVTSEPLEVAVKAWALLPTLKVAATTVPTAVVGQGLMVMPVGTVAVAVPVTPLRLAVMVTAPPVPTAVAFPALLPDMIMATAHGFDVLQVADCVTSFVVLSEYAARAVKGCVVPAAGETVFGFTVIVVGWFTKNPLHDEATTSSDTATKAAITDTFRSELGIMLYLPPQPFAEAAFKIVAEGFRPGWVPVPTCDIALRPCPLYRNASFSRSCARNCPFPD